MGKVALFDRCSEADYIQNRSITSAMYNAMSSSEVIATAQEDIPHNPNSRHCI